MSNVEILMTRREISELTGLTMNTLKTYTHLGLMPEPDVVYERTPLWKKKTITKWREGK